mgnify:CR=1 FL=1
MKKITSFVAIIALTLVSYTANAQYYVNTYNPAGQNPGDLNNDPEQPLAFLNGNSLGYTAVLTATTNNLRWSGNQTIPFTFNFNGNYSNQELMMKLDQKLLELLPIDSIGLTFYLTHLLLHLEGLIRPIGQLYWKKLQITFI